jgi:glucose/arabinose dehydrogenase
MKTINTILMGTQPGRRSLGPILTGLIYLFLSVQASVALAAFPSKHFPADTISDYYEVETIKMPKGLIAETDGLAIMPDGRIVAGFHRGEIMMYNPKTKTWKLFAEGIHDPLGIMAISNSEILVMQRPELTRIKDTNGDGIADEYLTVTDDFGLSGNYHEFAFGPIKDKKGNLYIALNCASSGAGIFPEVRGKLDTLGRPGRMYSAVPYRGWIMKLTPDGKLHPFASGFRSPNSIGFDANGNLYAADNQGDWLGTSKLYHVEEGKHYGHPASLLWKEGFSAHQSRQVAGKSAGQPANSRECGVSAQPDCQFAHATDADETVVNLGLLRVKC